MGKKNSNKNKKPERGSSSYCIEILDWFAPYSFSTNRNKHLMSGPYWEHASIDISGKFLFPEKIAEKEIQITIMGDRKSIIILNDPDKYDKYEPKCVGEITVRGEQRNGWGVLPMDAFPQITNLLAAGKYTYLIMTGHELYRGAAEIHSIYFCNKFDEEDW